MTWHATLRTLLAILWLAWWRAIVPAGLVIGALLAVARAALDGGGNG